MRNSRWQGSCTSDPWRVKSKQSSVEVNRWQGIRQGKAKMVEEEEEEDGRCFKEDLRSNERNESDDSNNKSE